MPDFESALRRALAHGWSREADNDGFPSAWLYLHRGYPSPALYILIHRATGRVVCPTALAERFPRLGQDWGAMLELALLEAIALGR